MQRRTSTSRRATALGVVALVLLKSALVLALIAFGAVPAQARTLVEVCTAFGVVTVAVDATDGPQPPVQAHSEPSCGPGGCAPPLAAAPDIGAAACGDAAGAAFVPWTDPPSARDRSASWFAAIGHAPPGRG